MSGLSRAIGTNGRVTTSSSSPIVELSQRRRDSRHESRSPWSSSTAPATFKTTSTSCEEPAAVTTIFPRIVPLAFFGTSIPNQSACNFSLLDICRPGKSLAHEIGAAKIEAPGARQVHAPDRKRTCCDFGGIHAKLQHIKFSGLGNTAEAPRVPRQIRQPAFRQACVPTYGMQTVFDKECPVRLQRGGELCRLLRRRQIIHIALGTRIVQQPVRLIRGHIHLDIGPAQGIGK